MRFTVVSFALLSALVVAPLSSISATQQISHKSTPAQRKGDSSVESKNTETDLVQLLSDARSAPAEFAADVLIKLVGSNRASSPRLKEELLEEAFHLATGAQEPLPRVGVGPYPVDTRHGLLAEGFQLKLDTLSLQCRAVDALIPINKLKARELFAQIPKLSLGPLACGDGLVYDVSAFYNTLAKVATASFSSGENAREEHVRFVERYIGDLRSPVQVAPMAAMIRSLEVSPLQRSILADLLGAGLGKAPGDDRSFSAWLYHIAREVEALAAICDQENTSSTGLLRALRMFYVRQFSAVRCSDTIGEQMKNGQMPEEVNRFNRIVNSHNARHSGGEIASIKLDEIKPSRIEGAVDVHSYWDSRDSKHLLLLLKELRFGPNSRAGSPRLTLTQRDTVEWKARLQDFLQVFRRWCEDSEKSREDFFHQKCIVYRSLLDLIPPGADRDFVLIDFIGFINEFDLQWGSRIVWFYDAKPLIKEMTITPAHNSEFSHFTSLIKNSVLYLYIELERVLQGPVDASARSSS